MHYTNANSSSPMNKYPRSTSPLPAPANYRQHQPTVASAAAKRYKYLSRLCKLNQMDFEFAFWQMFYLFVAPQKVFRNFNYRKHTKSQFARDDPAFLVLLSVWLFVSSICFALAMGLGWGKALLFVLFVVFVDFIGAGILASTFFWRPRIPRFCSASTMFAQARLVEPDALLRHRMARFRDRLFVCTNKLITAITSCALIHPIFRYLSNKYLRRDKDGADVEWGYAFDVHINAFFPPLSLLHCFQILLFNSILGHDGFLSCFVSNSFWLASIVYYLYITFLGYSNLPMLQNTRAFLFPLPLLFLAYLGTLLAGWNLSHMLMDFYHYRVL